MPSSRDIIEGVLSKPSVFRSRDKLYPEYIPNYLPHREEQIKQLAQYFRSLLIEPGSFSQRVLLVGAVGTGKTATAYRFGIDFTLYAKQRGIKLDYVHINCHRDRTLTNVAREIAKQLKIPVPQRGISVPETFSMILRYMDERDRYAIITLDEFDYFIAAAGSEDVYFIVRLYDEYPLYKKRLNFIFIVRNYSGLSSLDSATESYLLRNVINFPKYTSRELFDILKLRVSEAFHEGTVDDEVLQYIADTIGADKGGSGSARMAIEALRLAGQEADREGSPRVLIEHVRRALPYIIQEIPIIIDNLNYLHLHELLLLLAAIRVLKYTNQPYVRIGDVEQEYRYICEEFNERPRKHTQIYEYVRNMKRMGIIDAHTSGKGYRGKSTLIGIRVGPLDLLEKVVIDMINKKRFED